MSYTISTNDKLTSEDKKTINNIRNICDEIVTKLGENKKNIMCISILTDKVDEKYKLKSDNLTVKFI